MHKRGKVIFLNGPSFSGKTRLMLDLIVDFQSLRPVMFEQFFDKQTSRAASIKAFYDRIGHLVSSGCCVVAECVNDYAADLHIHNQDFRSISPLCITVFPTLDRHKLQYAQAVETFSEAAINSRTGGGSIEDLRRLYLAAHPVQNTLIFDGTNYGDVTTKVREYLGECKPELPNPEYGIFSLPGTNRNYVVALNNLTRQMVEKNLRAVAATYDEAVTISVNISTRT